MDAVRTRRWYQLHWLTWLAIAVELVALGYLQSFEQREAGTYDSVFGWPSWQLWRFETFSPRFEYVWRLKPLLFNGLVWAFLTVSVGWLVETRLRRRNRLQFSLRAVCELFAVVAVALTLFKHRTIVEGGVVLLGFEPGRPFQMRFDRPYELNAWAWMAVVVIFCAVSCSVRFFIHLASEALYRLLKGVNPKRA